MPTLPSLSPPVLDGKGRFSQAWVGFLTGLTRGAGPIETLAVGVSPFAYTASAPGCLSIYGGAGIALSLTRGRSTVMLNANNRLVPMAQGDKAQVTFTAAPAVAFIPRGA